MDPLTRGSAVIFVGVCMDINKTLNSIGIKTAVGSILVSIVIFSAFHLLQILRLYLDLYSNGIVLQVFAFGLVFLTGSSSLFILFRQKKMNSHVLPPNSPSSIPGIDGQAIAIKFVEGFLDGVTKQQRTLGDLQPDLKQKSDE